jgi:hypothetical protein
MADWLRSVDLIGNRNIALAQEFPPGNVRSAPSTVLKAKPWLPEIWNGHSYYANGTRQACELPSTWRDNWPLSHTIIVRLVSAFDL